MRQAAIVMEMEGQYAISKQDAGLPTMPTAVFHLARRAADSAF